MRRGGEVGLGVVELRLRARHAAQVGDEAVQRRPFQVLSPEQVVLAGRAVQRCEPMALRHIWGGDDVAAAGIRQAKRVAQVGHDHGMARPQHRGMRPDRHRRADEHHVEAPLLREFDRMFVLRHFGAHIGALAATRFYSAGLVAHRSIAAVAEHDGRRRDDDTPDLGIARRAQHVGGAVEGGGLERGRVRIREGHRRMEDIVAACGRGEQRAVACGDIADDALDRQPLQRGEVARRAHQGANANAVREQHAREVGADQAVGAGDEGSQGLGLAGAVSHRCIAHRGALAASRATARARPA